MKEDEKILSKLEDLEKMFREFRLEVSKDFKRFSKDLTDIKRTLKKISAVNADSILLGPPSTKSPIYIFLDNLKWKIDENKGQPVNEKDFISFMETKLDVGVGKIEKLLRMLIKEGSILRSSLGQLEIKMSRKKPKKKLLKQDKPISLDN